MPVAESLGDVPVPRPMSKQQKPDAAVEPSPVLQAPLAPQEAYEEKQQKQQQQAVAATEILTASTAATTAAAAPTRLNGQAVVDATGMAPGAGDTDTSFDTGTYQPNTTFYDEEEEEDEEEAGKPKPSLEEEIQQLDADFSRSEQNHLAAAAAASPATASSPAAKPADTKKSGVVGTVVMSVLAAMLLFAVLFYVLYFSGIEHPALTEVRNHLQFLEPARDFVSRQAENIASYFKK